MRTYNAQAARPRWIEAWRGVPSAGSIVPLVVRVGLDTEEREKFGGLPRVYAAWYSRELSRWYYAHNNEPIPQGGAIKWSQLPIDDPR